MDYWLKGCEICTTGLCSAVEELKGKGHSERDACKQLAEEAAKKLPVEILEDFSPKRLRDRYRYHSGKKKVAEIPPRDQEKKEKNVALCTECEKHYRRELGVNGVCPTCQEEHDDNIKVDGDAQLETDQHQPLTGYEKRIKRISDYASRLTTNITQMNRWLNCIDAEKKQEMAGGIDRGDIDRLLGESGKFYRHLYGEEPHFRGIEPTVIQAKAGEAQ